MGYRTEQLYGEGYKNPIEVMTHEVFNLQNTDTLTTLANGILKESPIGEKLNNIAKVMSQETHDDTIDAFINAVSENETIGHGFFYAVISEIEAIIGHKINYVLWLCDTIDDIIESYSIPDSDEILNEFDKYEDGIIILSDCGKDGKLYGYEEKPTIIDTIIIDKKTTIDKLSTKDLAAILYMYYLDNYCQDKFSFDKGKTRKEIEKHYKKIQKKLSTSELTEIKDKIVCRNNEGTDYDSLTFKINECPDLFLQVTSMIDYKGNRVSNYKGNCNWTDVGMFFVDYNDCEFKNL